MKRHWARQTEGVWRLRIWRLNLYFRDPVVAPHKVEPSHPCGCRLLLHARGWELWAAEGFYPWRYFTSKAGGWYGLRIGHWYVYLRDPALHPQRFSERSRIRCRRLAHLRCWELWARWQTYPR